MQNQAQPIDRKIMRENNQNMLLNLIRKHAPVSRMRLKELSGLSLGTITGITTILIEQQLVIEQGIAQSTGGRKAGLLAIAPDGGYSVGISLKEYEIAGAILNLHGDVVYAETWPCTLRDNAIHAVTLIAEGITAFIARSTIPYAKFIGLGCGISGAVDAKAGISIDSWILNWHQVSIGSPLKALLHLPVFVDNSVNCLASYENLYGHGHTYQNFLLISLGRGLGLAMIIHGALYRGSQGLGAELGHIPFIVNGRLCECGKHGCLEAYVADHGIFATYCELSHASPITPQTAVDASSIDILFDKAQRGDQLACLAFHQTGVALGIGLASLVNLLNPECILIYEVEGHHVGLLMEPLQTTMQEHIFSQLGRQLSLIVEPNSGMLNWARGAGCLVLQDFYSLSSKA